MARRLSCFSQHRWWLWYSRRGRQLLLSHLDDIEQSDVNVAQEDSHFVGLKILLIRGQASGRRMQQLAGVPVDEIVLIDYSRRLRLLFPIPLAFDSCGRLTKVFCR